MRNRFSRPLASMFYATLALIVFGVMVSACGDDDPVIEPIEDASEVFFVNAAANSTGLDLVFDNDVVAENIMFGAGDTEYRTIEAGSRNIRITKTGDTGTTYVSATVPFTKDEHYTIFAVADSTNTINATVLSDDLTEPADGKFRLRFVNLSPDAPSVKLAFAGSGSGAIFSDVKYGSTVNTFTTLDTVSAPVRIQNNTGGGGSGGGGGGGATGIVPDLNYTFESGHIYTIALIGKVSDSTLKAVVLMHHHD